MTVAYRLRRLSPNMLATVRRAERMRPGAAAASWLRIVPPVALALFERRRLRLFADAGLAGCSPRALRGPREPLSPAAACAPRSRLFAGWPDRAPGLREGDLFESARFAPRFPGLELLRRASVSVSSSAVNAAPGSNPDTVTLSMRLRVSFSILESSGFSSRHTSDRATPLLPARPVRPMRWT